MGDVTLLNGKLGTFVIKTSKSAHKCEDCALLKYANLETNKGNKLCAYVSGCRNSKWVVSSISEEVTEKLEIILARVSLKEVHL